MIAFIMTAALWIRSRYSGESFEFSRMQRSFQFQSDAHGLSLRVTDLNPTMSAIVSGMTPTPNGWIVSPGHPVTLRFEALQTDDQAAPIGGPLSINRPRFQAQGFAWFSGFTAPHADMATPFPACQVNLFTLSYTEAIVLSVLAMLAGGYFGMRGAGMSGEGRCPCCGHDMTATPARCPHCGAIPRAQAISPQKTSLDS